MHKNECGGGGGGSWRSGWSGRGLAPLFLGVVGQHQRLHPQPARVFWGRALALLQELWDFASLPIRTKKIWPSASSARSRACEPPPAPAGPRPPRPCVPAAPARRARCGAPPAPCRFASHACVLFGFAFRRATQQRRGERRVSEGGVRDRNGRRRGTAARKPSLQGAKRLVREPPSEGRPRPAKKGRSLRRERRGQAAALTSTHPTRAHRL